MAHYGKTFALSLLLWTSAVAQERPSIHQQIALLDSIYTRVLNSYVEKSLPAQLFRTAIDASLNTLDPYSNYFNAAEANEFRLSLQAKFGGVGFAINTVNDSIYVREVFKDAPADQQGIKPGDILLQLDNSSLAGKTIDDAVSLLRGVPGTAIRIKIFRPSANATREVTVTRQEIKLPSVPYYGLLPGNNGYIKITGEVESTGSEVKNALLELQKKASLQGLVLDLRGNIGGLMSQAISVANLFIEKGKVAVSDKSWYGDTVHYFKEEPVDIRIPLVVLVDTQTASSGEILAGALQDHDRAILIGQGTFGKGMVQRLFNLPNNELLKLTTAYYYTPSGRCIQRREKGGERTREWTDSLKKIVYTKNGRPVVSYDGITPDIRLPISTTPRVISDLTEWPGTHLFLFANQYVLAHPVITPASGFRITDKDYDAFVGFLKKEKFQLTSLSEQKLDELQNLMEEEGYTQAALSNVSALGEQLNREKEKQFVVYKKEIKSLLESEIAGVVYYNAGKIENTLKDDEGLKKAVEVLNNWEKYRGLLKRR